MNDKPDGKWRAWIVIVALLLYPLTAGPVFWLTRNQPVIDHQVATFYYPLFVMADWVPETLGGSFYDFINIGRKSGGNFRSWPKSWPHHRD